MRTTSVRPNKKGLPSNKQIMAHKAGTGLATQYGQAPAVPLPEPALAAPPLQTQSEPPRIAGARDPVTQNYWRGMFPPAVTPTMTTGVPMRFVQPGVHPSQMFGMPMGRQWGY
ncbi:MAG: hypothetical protein TREMPRED_003876 [Tremellales sp. Tagirdzhanova-0007]|nr:MAG: hypothetical protein TREMPRED_003876 [Tremellales sp. Tagirdzhanova-0007]